MNYNSRCKIKSPYYVVSLIINDYFISHKLKFNISFIDVKVIVLTDYVEIDLRRFPLKFMKIIVKFKYSEEGVQIK
jgi:hypothetical protein